MAAREAPFFRTNARMTLWFVAIAGLGASCSAGPSSGSRYGTSLKGDSLAPAAEQQRFETSLRTAEFAVSGRVSAIDRHITSDEPDAPIEYVVRLAEAEIHLGEPGRLSRLHNVRAPREKPGRCLFFISYPRAEMRSAPDKAGHAAEILPEPAIAIGQRVILLWPEEGPHPAALFEWSDRRLGRIEQTVRERFQAALAAASVVLSGTVDWHDYLQGRSMEGPGHSSISIVNVAVHRDDRSVADEPSRPLCEPKYVRCTMNVPFVSNPREMHPGLRISRPEVKKGQRAIVLWPVSRHRWLVVLPWTQERADDIASTIGP